MSTQKTAKTKPQTTEIAFILDRSGSMQPHTEAAIAGFNAFLRDQQQVEGQAKLTLVLFDDRVEIPIGNLPVSEVVDLDTRTYTPRGSTALLDAIGQTIDASKHRIKALPEKDRPDQVIFAIFTDGEENSSRRFTWHDIAGKIRRRQEKQGWEFLFLGANQDAIATAAQMSIHAHNAATADYSAKGVRGSAKTFSRKVQAMRESLSENYCGAPSEDLMKPMDEILREEEGRESD
ncbi:MAG: VWA domain-containing protein [Verrucomicrobiaceae bacterium]|nr:VWA domain-containing protein [Verrucomicrobiaceae bacterium]